MTTDKIRQLAEAFIRVAAANHYMVGVVGDFTYEELDEARQVLITIQNLGPQFGFKWRRLDCALDLLDDVQKKRRCCDHGESLHETKEYRGDKSRSCCVAGCLCKRFHQ